MPTLEDTAIDFPVTTLNDLLEVEAKAGVTVGADADKYRRWAFLSTGAAGLLAIILAVVLITGGSDDGGGGTKARTAVAPPGTVEVPLNVAASRIANPTAGGYYEITSGEDGSVLAAAAMLTSLKDGAELGSVKTLDISVAVTKEEKKALDTAKQNTLRFSPAAPPVAGQPADTATTVTTAATEPAAPTPEAPAPETPAPSQPTG